MIKASIGAVIAPIGFTGGGVIAGAGQPILGALVMALGAFGYVHVVVKALKLDNPSEQTNT